MRHFFRLVREIVQFSLLNRMWWFIPMMVLIGLVGFAVSATQTVVPVAVYTLF